MPPNSTLTFDNDQAIRLICAARSGDERALQQLYVACRVVEAYILKQYRDPVFAREIWHDTVTEIWKGATEFGGHSRFTTWAIGIARNLAATAARKRALWAGDPLPTDGVDEAPLADPQEGQESPLSCQADPCQLLSAQQRRDSVLSCIRKLSPKLQEALWLVYYAEMPQHKVADLLALNLNTVKTRVRDAHLKVKTCLGADAGVTND